jgi:hypothetical protein
MALFEQVVHRAAASFAAEIPGYVETRIAAFTLRLPALRRAAVIPDHLVAAEIARVRTELARMVADNLQGYLGRLRTAQRQATLTTIRSRMDGGATMDQLTDVVVTMGHSLRAMRDQDTALAQQSLEASILGNIQRLREAVSQVSRLAQSSNAHNGAQSGAANRQTTGVYHRAVAVSGTAPRSSPAAREIVAAANAAQGAVVAPISSAIPFETLTVQGATATPTATPHPTAPQSSTPPASLRAHAAPATLPTPNVTPRDVVPTPMDIGSELKPLQQTERIKQEADATPVHSPIQAEPQPLDPIQVALALLPVVKAEVLAKALAGLPAQAESSLRQAMDEWEAQARQAYGARRPASSVSTVREEDMKASAVKAVEAWYQRQGRARAR